MLNRLHRVWNTFIAFGALGDRKSETYFFDPCEPMPLTLISLERIKKQTEPETKTWSNISKPHFSGLLFR